MTDTAFTYTDSTTGLTLEVVTTDQLKTGDVILNHGAAMQLGPFSERPNDQGHPERGPTRWARGYIVPGSPLGAIPAPWLDTDDTGSFWTVQGNTLATWSRYTDPAAAVAAMQTNTEQ